MSLSDFEGLVPAWAANIAERSALEMIFVDPSFALAAGAGWLSAAGAASPRSMRLP